MYQCTDRHQRAWASVWTKPTGLPDSIMLQAAKDSRPRRYYSVATSSQELEIYPHLWAGVGLVRGGAGTALVGSHQQVADLIEEYAALGIGEFILSGYPHLEEAYWFGEGVLPELRRRGALAARRDRTRVPVTA